MFWYDCTFISAVFCSALISLALSWNATPRAGFNNFVWDLIAFLSTPKSSLNPNTSLVIWMYASSSVKYTDMDGRLSNLSVEELWASYCASFICMYGKLDFAPLFLKVHFHSPLSSPTFSRLSWSQGITVLKYFNVPDSFYLQIHRLLRLHRPASQSLGFFFPSVRL